jgi:hypothetical protein
MRKASWGLVTGVLLVGGILLCSSSPAVELTYRPPRPANGMSVGMEILVDGQPLRPIEHEGKTYLPVPRLGAEYTIRISNHGPRRITAIVSVDGLSVINGKRASASHPGYMVLPRSSIVIAGWRRDLDRVAAFSFQERDKSYAHLTGRPENIGVIGLVAIEELTWLPRPVLKQESLSDSSARMRQGKVGNTGTGYGRDIDSRVYYVPFVRSDNKRTITFYYDTVEALRKAGVPVDDPLPRPFPADTEFVPPPKLSRK